MACSVQDFFDDCPTKAEHLKGKIQEFLAEQCGPAGSGGRPLVCVTSGGTTVPLEKRCVRFIDNFSGGTRGALSTEAFLEAGYAVIFLNRRHSIQPFTKGLPSGEIMDTLTEVLDLNGGSAPRVKDDAATIVHQAVARAKQAASEKRLLRITFETLFEYLKVVALTLRDSGRQASFYLAAAVSDFYIPWRGLADHKIQSSGIESTLQLTLNKVPKMLGVLRSEWAPEAFVVSFKLETDDHILIKKAEKSIESYGVHAVIANILETRKEQVKVVSRTAGGGAGSLEVVTISRSQGEPFIEKQIVEHVVAAHKRHVEGK